MEKGKLQSLSLLLVRIVIGLIFIIHGWPKITGMPELLGLPSFVGLIVGLVEVIFGFLVLIGFGFPYTTYPLIIVILVALLGVQYPRGIGAGSERDTLILVTLVLLSIFGAGKYALMKKK